VPLIYIGSVQKNVENAGNQVSPGSLENSPLNVGGRLWYYNKYSYNNTSGDRLQDYTRNWW